ncbi:phage integrase N-terminal SAM-like domain-containing protein [Thermithiobacillus tepidarius]|nr:phage integrase N-terminal SAM-like domain-containing protein [Thermithiobacillus tepidarius]
MTTPSKTAGILTSLAKPKLLDQVRDLIRTKHYSLRTEQAYLGWIRRFILFHRKRHPLELGAPEVLNQPLPWLDNLTRAKRPARLPVVLTVTEV